MIRWNWNWKELITDAKLQGNRRGKMTLRFGDQVTGIYGCIGGKKDLGRKTTSCFGYSEFEATLGLLEKWNQ